MSLTFNPRVTKRFCKVCFDSKKPENEYSSHFLKDKPGPHGKVICPTLLATICRYCRCSGHFKSHCPKLLERSNSNRYKQPKRTIKNRQHRRVLQLRKAVNIFDVLCEEPVRIEKVAMPKVATAPALQGAWKVNFQIEPVQKAVQKAPVVQKAVQKAPALQIKLMVKYANRIQQLEAELAEAKEDLEEEKASCNNWADKGDIEDAEIRVECLEEKLVRLKNKN